MTGIEQSPRSDLSARLQPGTRRFEKIWNTFVRVSIPFAGTRKARYWEHRSIGDQHGPDSYVELHESSDVLIEEVIQRASGPQARVLDLGCNVGRHLNALYGRGFTNLYGIDVQREAVEYMSKVFPAMSGIAHIERDTFQAYLPRIADRFFEVVFTFGATIELVPPSFPICQHMARVASRAVVLVINESGHAYPRLWEIEFLRGGFLLTKLLRPVHPGTELSLLVFQRLTGPHAP